MSNLSRVRSSSISLSQRGGFRKDAGQPHKIAKGVEEQRSSWALGMIEIPCNGLFPFSLLLSVNWLNASLSLKTVFLQVSPRQHSLYASRRKRCLEALGRPQTFNWHVPTWPYQLPTDTSILIDHSIRSGGVSAWLYHFLGILKITLMSSQNHYTELPRATPRTQRKNWPDVGTATNSRATLPLPTISAIRMEPTQPNCSLT